jgi:hypothetical protein
MTGVKMKRYNNTEEYPTNIRYIIVTLNFQHTSSTLPSTYVTHVLVLAVAYCELKKKISLHQLLKCRWNIHKRLLMTKSTKGVAISLLYSEAEMD